MLVHLFIIYIKNLFKFPLVRNIAVIIPFSYPTYNITAFLFINIYLTGNLFRELKANF